MKMIIKNRYGLKIAVLVEKAKIAKGLAFILHGLGGFKEQPHIEIFAQAFKDAGYTVLRYDATNSIGESGGQMEDATTTSYLHDLEDIIAWASQQAWYIEPFVLAGHSLGSLSSLLYAEKNPKKVKAIAPISSVISGELLIDAYNKDKGLVYMKKWEKTGRDIRKSESDPNNWYFLFLSLINCCFFLFYIPNKNCFGYFLQIFNTIYIRF